VLLRRNNIMRWNSPDAVGIPAFPSEWLQT
jgi:hypothetical protein